MRGGRSPSIEKVCLLLRDPQNGRVFLVVSLQDHQKMGSLKKKRRATHLGMCPNLGWRGANAGQNGPYKSVCQISPLGLWKHLPLAAAAQHPPAWNSSAQRKRTTGGLDEFKGVQHIMSYFVYHIYIYIFPTMYIDIYTSKK